MERAAVVIDAQTQANVENWLHGDYDAETKSTIRKMQQEQPEELINAFYQTMSFGTGGLRGIMGVGPNRMNFYTVRAATQGLANYLQKLPKQKQRHSVFIGFDCRHNSHAFAIEAAKVLAANDIEVFLYKELRPVPNVSFGVLHKKCTAGIMITASHNPPQYNGYKVYWSYGGQVLPPHDQGIIDEVKRVTAPSMVKIADLPNPLIHEVCEEIDRGYFEAIYPLQIHPGDNQSKGKELKVVYTSLHGDGITMIPEALREWGFTNVSLVQAQAKPDGDFPTVKSPNPEEHEALALGIAQLQAEKADLLMGTDPDTDRLGVVVMHKGKPFFFDGNQVACILLEHVCRGLTQSKLMPVKATCMKTIVTSELFRTIADHYQVTCMDVLTGFKYIGEKIHEWEEVAKAGIPSHHYIFGAEESYGYLLGTHVRDKDAIISAACVCEAALQMKLQGKTLVDLLHEIYFKYGVCREKLLSLTFEGKEGADKMAKMMKHLRNTPPHILDGKQVVLVEDYLERTSFYPESGRKEPLTLPHSDVLRFWLADGTKIVIRPSGTEPKIKLYCGVLEKHHHSDEHALDKAIASCDTRANLLLASLKKLILA